VPKVNYDSTQDPEVLDPSAVPFMDQAFQSWWKDQHGGASPSMSWTAYKSTLTDPDDSWRVYYWVYKNQAKFAADAQGIGDARKVREKTWRDAFLDDLTDATGAKVQAKDSSGRLRFEADGVTPIYQKVMRPRQEIWSDTFIPLTEAERTSYARQQEAEDILYGLNREAAPVQRAEIRLAGQKLAEEEAILAATGTQRQELGRRQVELQGQEITGDIQEQQVRQMALKDAQDAYKFAKVERIVKPFTDLAGSLLKDTAEGITGLGTTMAKGFSTTGKHAFQRGASDLGAGQKDVNNFLAPQFKPIPGNLQDSVMGTAPAAKAVVPTMRSIPAAKLMGQGSAAAGNMMIAKSPAGKLLAPSLKNSPAGQAMMPQMQATTEIDMSGITGAAGIPRLGLGIGRKKKLKKNTYNTQMSAVRRQF
jgi:hypothetical protein